MPPICNYPLKFRPLFRRYLWGGRRLETLLSKPLGAGDDYAESWEIVDHGDDQSVVTAGPAAGLTLQQLAAEHGAALLGRHNDFDHFPLLFKFLDCNRVLSVQVHPNDEQGARLDPPDLGKTEAWVVLHADPGCEIYAGLKEGVTREKLQAALAAGECDQCLHVIQPQVGDCIFVAAGTVHALGAGLVIAEIQQASDTTFRLFDWNRVDADGNPRQLHVEQSLATINFARGPVAPQTPQPTLDAKRQRLVECDKFVLDRCQADDSLSLSGDDRFHLLAVLDGTAEIEGVTFSTGETCLLPAAMSAVEAKLSGPTTLLDIYLP